MDELGERWNDGLGGQEGTRRQGFPFDPHRLKRALLGGKRRLIAAGVIGAIVGFLYVKLVMVSYYETVVVLKYEGDVSIDDRRPSAHAIVPAADALLQQAVLGEIRDELGFDSTLTDLAAWIDYEADYRAGILRFAVTGETGDDAAEYARVVTNVFMAYHSDRQSRRIEAEIARTDKRIDAAEEDAERALRHYNAFREKHGISDLPTERQSMLESAAQLRADSELAVPEIRALEAQVSSLETQLASTPKTSLVGGGVSPERSTYERLRQELASAQASLSPDHPRVQALQHQVAQLRAQLRSGGGSASSGGLVGANASYEALVGQLREAKSNLAALRERQKGLSGMAARAQSRVADFSGLEGEASALLAAVKVNENLLNDLRSTKSALEDALRDPPSGFVVLDPGGVPEYPVANKLKPVVFLAIPMLSVTLVLLVLLRREFRGLSLQTPREIAFWGRGPVLASTPWPTRAEDGLDDLVAGLDDSLPSAKGRFLVIGSGPDESRLAREFVDRINRDWFPANESTVTPTMVTPAPAERAPLQTPPPSGPYPVGRSGAPSVALVRLPSAPEAEALRVVRPEGHVELEAWNGPLEGQSIRRAARLADRVLILVRSGAISVLELHGIQRRFGRDQGVGFIVVGLPEELLTLPDRVGDVAAFWRG